MASKIIVANGIYDLSEINTIHELREEIKLLKADIKKDEEELEERFRRFPQYAVRSAADNLLPSFINKMIANGTWKLLLSGVAMFANPFAKGLSFKKSIVGSAKKLGLMALVKGAYSYFSNRKVSRKPEDIVARKAPAVTTLNTKPRIPRKA